MDVSIDVAAMREAEVSCITRLQNYTPSIDHCSMTWDQMLCWEPAPLGQIIKQPCPSYVHDVVKTAYAFRLCGQNGEWHHPFTNNDNISTGWTNYSDCFKEDPDFKEIKNDLARITLMANIGYAVSLVSLVVAVLIMLISRRLHCKSNSLHINLFVAFIMRSVISLTKDVLFVDGLGLEKDVYLLSTNKLEFAKDSGTHWECKLIVTTFMYAVSVSMMWIFMEGLYLHMLVYKTLFTERNGIRMYVGLGWLTPFLSIVPWVLVRAYKDDTLCWNVDNSGYLWIIVGPIILTVGINFVFFVNIVRVLCIRMKSHRSMSMQGGSQQVRKLAKFALVLIPLFGVLYIATSAYPAGLDKRADMIYLYWEMFYNSFQGFVLAVLFCFLNEEVHNEIRRCWNRRRRHDSVFTRTFTLSTYRKGSCFSHTSHNQCSQQAIRSGHRHTPFQNDTTQSISDQNNDLPPIYTNNKSENGVSKSVHYETDKPEQIYPLIDH